MIKLKDLLFEQTEDLKPIAMEFLKVVKQKVGSKAPRGHGGFEVAWTTPTIGRPEITLLHDTPREIRHPDEYFDMNYERRPEVKKKMQQWDELESILWKVVIQFEARRHDIIFGVGGDVGGGGVKKTGRPRSSNF